MSRNAASDEDDERGQATPTERRSRTAYHHGGEGLTASTEWRMSEWITRHQETGTP